MKCFNKIFILFFVLTAFCCCEHGTGGEGGTTDDDIFLPTDGYIFFNVQNPTRGTLIYDLLRADFNVLGYHYEADWGTAIAMASQDYQFTYIDGANNSSEIEMGVFYNTGAPSDNTREGVQLVRYVDNTEDGIDNGIHTYSYTDNRTSYSGLRAWRDLLNYAFFAWYPTSLKANGATGESLNNPAYEGEPYITYTLPSDRSEMKDVLTACEIDVNKNFGSSVNFKMQHRLSLLDIKAHSIIKAKELKKVWTGKTDLKDPNGNSVTIESTKIADNAKVIVKTITDLTLTLDDIRTTARIPLNTKDRTLAITSTGESMPTYQGFDCSGIVLEYFDSEEQEKSLMSDDAGKLILIPQDDPITATLGIKYVVSCERTDGGTYDVVYDYSASTDLVANISSLHTGESYFIELTFTASGIFVKVKQSNKWPSIDVEYEFE